MSYTPPMRILNGLPLQRAEMYGKPHIGAEYTGKTSYERLIDFCPICGLFATNTHHLSPKSTSKVFTLQGKKAAYPLRTALIALCGSGTMGCHSKFHKHHFEAYWHWYGTEYAKSWWNGEMLESIEPHSPDLYEFGYWQITDVLHGGTMLEIKEPV